MTTSPISWPEAQRICDIPEVREALDKFAADAHEEHMLTMVSAIMGNTIAQWFAVGPVAVGKITGADEYGPMIEWRMHWADLIGRVLYASRSPAVSEQEPEDDPVVWTGPTVRQTVKQHKSGRISIEYADPLPVVAASPAVAQPVADERVPLAAVTRERVVAEIERVADVYGLDIPDTAASKATEELVWQVWCALSQPAEEGDKA